MGRRLELVNSPDQRASMLTTQQRKILRLTALGQSADQIAQELWLAPKTIEQNKHKVFQTLGVETSLKAITYCLDTEVFTLEELTDCYPEEIICRARQLTERQIFVLESIGFYGGTVEAGNALGGSIRTYNNHLGSIHELFDLHGKGSTIQSFLIYKRALKMGIIGNSAEAISLQDALSKIDNAVNEASATIASVLEKLTRQNGNLNSPIRIAKKGDSTILYDPSKNEITRVPYGEAEENELEVFNGNDHSRANDLINYGAAIALRIVEKSKEATGNLSIDG